MTVDDIILKVRYRLADVDTHTGDLTVRLGPGRQNAGEPVWSPDGQTLAFRYCTHPHGSAVRTVCLPSWETVISACPSRRTTRSLTEYLLA